MTTNAPLILVDGSSYLYRAFHVCHPLLIVKDRLQSGKGVINMMRRLQKITPIAQQQ